MQEFDEIYNLLKDNPQNSFGYKMLGDYYLMTNVNQAFLCYEQAQALCNNVEESSALKKQMEICCDNSGFRVRSVSFVILSYDAKNMMIDCLESIRSGCVPDSYEIVIVDNDSRDGIRDYLVNQKDIKLQLNDHNTSFAEGCNQGVKIANPYHDIFLLNNDTIVPPLALFYMRLALYEADDIGSVGPVTNFGPIAQLAVGNLDTKEQWLEAARSIHLPSMNSCENKAWLSGFALLIRRKVWDYIGNLDERFKRGNFEDTDYGIRILMAGYRNVLCHNAFIYHYGSVSMSKDPAAYNRSLRDNERKLKEKLGFNFDLYSKCYNEMISMMDAHLNEGLSVLEIGCGFGQTLSKITYLYPFADVIGFETEEAVARAGRHVANVIYVNENLDGHFLENRKFDYIFLTDVINHFEDALRMLTEIKEYLKEDGKLILLTRNLFHGDVFLKILKGKFETIRDNDARIRHFYTKDEIMSLLTNAGLVPRFLLKMAVEMNLGEGDQRILNIIKDLPHCTIGGIGIL